MKEYKRSLTENGICAIVGYTTMRHMLSVMFSSSCDPNKGRKQVGFLGAKKNKYDLALLATMLEDERIRPVLDRRYSLRQVPEALKYLQQGHARGKVVINIARELHFA